MTTSIVSTAPTKKRIKLDPPSKKSPKTNQPQKKKKKTSIIETTDEHYRVIDEILGYRVLWNEALGQAFGVCSLTGVHLPFHFFPVLTREPLKSGQVPLQIKEDRGYFAGGDKPSTVRIAIIKAFQRIFPDSDPVAQGWVNWQVWKYNVAYYSAPVFNAGPSTMGDIRERLVNTYPYGGAIKTSEERIARTCAQKQFLTAVSAKQFFSDRMPPNLPEGASFLPFDYLWQKSIELKAVTEKTLLEKKSLSKAVHDAEEPDSESDDDEEDEDSDSSSE